MPDIARIAEHYQVIHCRHANVYMDDPREEHYQDHLAGGWQHDPEDLFLYIDEVDPEEGEQDA